MSESDDGPGHDWTPDGDKGPDELFKELMPMFKKLIETSGNVDSRNEAQSEAYLAAMALNKPCGTHSFELIPGKTQVFCRMCAHVETLHTELGIHYETKIVARMVKVLQEIIRVGLYEFHDKKLDGEARAILEHVGAEIPEERTDGGS